ncbi:hypothetical protein HMPREF9336_00184 [Segniliparus rugosus ATCC BAA-974]|uniref:Secreted protein n=2 Tax=Segniliparus rugosus TaxID=286804 RepID=E5XL15_SEGRC|nr:hypothetical protein HMPREF9336_00184 [Segniliparus rugosus ATCC BAA-974]
MIRQLLLVALFGCAAAPRAAADPQFPDLDGFAAVDEAAYNTYHTYGTPGWQFAAPGGTHCRYTVNVRGGALSLMCWGALPGAPAGQNAVSLATGGADFRPAAFTKSSVQTYGYRDDGYPGMPRPTPITERDYPPLPQGQKLVVSKMGAVMTCAVGDGGATACQVELQRGEDQDEQRHGFVLSPEGSWTF